MKPKLGRIFITGLLTLIPAVATLYLLVWLIGAADRLFGKPLRWLMPDETYLAGTGIVVAIAIVFGVGVLMHGVLFRRLFRTAEAALLAVPLVRSVYSAVKDLIALFGRNNGPAMEVVAVTLPGTNWRLLGFVTRSEFGDLPEGIGKAGEVAVYLPMSYQVGGYTVIVPRGAVTCVNLSREEAMKFILTAGLKAAPAPRLS
ncbi:MAG TPA: DUF502 domain-containing protein [Burkholderiales bacterium]|nr:DUF502 domain-containing protein [Burkholderiales bacterium]